jgi:Flp pilus assembly pilin Flp
MATSKADRDAQGLSPSPARNGLTINDTPGGQSMLNFIKTFHKDEDGAVTVDFVVLTAAIVLLGLAVGTAISNGAGQLANSIKDDLINQT